MAGNPGGGQSVEEETTEEGAHTITSEVDLPKRYEPAWKRLGQSLNDDDLKSGALMKMFVNELHRLSEESVELRTLRAEFHQADKEVAVLKATKGQSAELSALSNFLIAAGGVVGGIGTSMIFAQQWVSGILILAAGLLCIAFPHLIAWKNR
ncbi:hypothetical protein RJJ65_16955 [Rhizobium hidalgonense]|uniref:DUF2335 domain-containing protein n=1 Tax=Rhizobium hidalgonense TaxID=1538159 RepID=A0AAJ2GWF4_9HYPH|nr:hypothetical protein [Rhizobium hidalgonense]MDR9774323.1 hypothetical protein [Rhizobium hidalgonense]